MAETTQPNPHFLHLIMSHEAAAMQYLGKTAGPEGKIQKNLEMARFIIDTLDALRTKTTGNLTEDEKRQLDHTIYQLQMNYVDEREAEKKAAAEKPAKDTKPESSAESTPSFDVDSESPESTKDSKPDE